MRRGCYSHGNKTESIIYSLYHSKDYVNGSCCGSIITYGLYRNSGYEGINDSWQCQWELYYESDRVSSKYIGQDSGRGWFFHPVCGCHAGHEHGGCFFSIWISCRFWRHDAVSSNRRQNWQVCGKWSCKRCRQPVTVGKCSEKCSCNLWF